MNETMDDVQIRALRNRLGLTQEEFAHRLGVTFSTVNRWENGHAKPSKLALRALRSLLPPTVPMSTKEA
jgi:DNA-binding transcriptional regulator YiaG